MLARLLGGVAVTVAAASVSWGQTTPPGSLPKTKPVVPPTLTPMPAKELPPGKPLAATTPPTTAASAAAVITTPATTTLNGCNDPCNPCPAACCVPCGPPGKHWIDAGWLYWTTSGQNVPALVTTAPAGTTRETAGALGAPGTTTLFPTSRLNDDWRSGVYFNFGFWCDECQTRGFETNFFYLGNSNDNYNVGSPGTTILTRPFFNTTLGVQDTELVSFPDVLAGNINVSSETSVWGINPNFIKNCCCGPCGRFDVLLGFYYLNVSDDLVITENLTSLPGQVNVTPGTQFIVQDSFSTTNNFYGVNIGFAFERRFSHYYLGVRSGIAFGVNHQTVDINGSTTITPPGGPATTYAGGLLTQPSNIGRYERDEFAVLPWIGVRLGCQVTQHLRTYVGYDYLYLSNVARAGEQIDTRVNTTQIPPRTGGVSGPAFPQYTPTSSGFSLTGIRIGLEYRF